MLHSILRDEITAIVRLAATMVMTRAVTFAQAFIIMLILGRYSADAMGGMALALSIGQVLIVLGFSALIGTETEIARRFGARDTAGIPSFLASALVFAVLTGLLMCGGAIAMVWLLAQLGAVFGSHYADALAIALPAVKIIGLGMPMYCICLVASYYFEATGRPKSVTLLSMLGLLLAILLALLLIADVAGFGLDKGMAAAWTLTLMRSMQGTVALVMLWRENRSRWPVWSQITPGLPAHMRTLLGIGLPMSISDGTTTVAVAGMTFLMGGLGTGALNVYQMAAYFLGLLMMIGSGFATSITIRFTQACGADDLAQQRQVLQVGVLILLLLDVVVIGLYGLFPHVWAGFYAVSPAVAELVSVNQIWAILVFLVECPLILLIGIGRAKGMTVRLPLIKAACFTVVGLPLCYVVTQTFSEPQSYLLFSLVPTVLLALLIASWQWLVRSRLPVAWVG